MSIRYLTIEEVVEINKRMILMYSEKERVGVKEPALLESAVFRPQQTVFGEDAYPDIYSKAAALFESIAKNHAFENANKRTSLAAMIIFLRLNGIQFKMEQKQAEDLTVDMVLGKHDFKGLVDLIKNHCL